MERRFQGSARVSRVGDCVLAIADFFSGSPISISNGTPRQSSFRRDAETNTRDACATQAGTLCFKSNICGIHALMQEVANTQPRRRPWYRPSLTVQIMIGLIVGGAIGWLRPDWGNAVYFLRDIFINLIKSIIAPLVFSTIVVGIAGAGALRKVGRMGIKALVYFEIVTTAALFIGLAVVNFTKPGIGVTLVASNTDVAKAIGQSHPKTLIETIVHVFPSSVIESMVRGDVLQIVAFSVLFALALSAIGEKGRPIVRAMESLSQVMFKFTNYVMMFAPFGVGAAMAHTIGTQGLGVLLNLASLILSLYLALVIFILLIFGSVIAIARVPLDGTNGTPGRASAHRRLRYADRLFVQPRWIDIVSGDGVGVCRPGSRNDDGLAHGTRSADHHDADVDAYVEGCGRRSTRIAGHLVGDIEHVSAGGTRSYRCCDYLRRR